MIAQGRGGRIIGLPPASLLHTRNSLRSGLFPYRCVLWHGQAGTGIIERLFCKQIRHPSVDSVRWCVRSSFFSGSGAIRVLTGFGLNPALEFGAHGITVNAYAPGPVKTPMCTFRHCPEPKTCS